ncbi:hypothetical protein BC941DRAFT_430888 [Chlamydoabsidia padenii]|nr:hypothetical protein BC941DRAFT_430888 [Chlamydoabsidia padenii]
MKLVTLILSLILLNTLLLYAYPIIDNDQTGVANWNHPASTTPTTTIYPIPTKSKTSTPTPTSTSSSQNDTYPIYGNDHAITTQMAVLGSVFIALGLYLVGFGFRGFRVTLAVFGFLAIGLVTWVGLTNCQPSTGYINNDITMIVVPAGVGVVGAIVFFTLWYLGFYLIGAVGGLALGLYICCWKENLVIENLVARACFLAGMCVVFAALTFFLERYVILFATSFVGAYLFFVGVDVLARTGYVAGIRSIIDRNPLHTVHYVLDRDVYLLLAFTIVLFLISFGWQALINHGRYFGIRYTHGGGGGGGGLKSAAVTALAAAATAAAATHLADEHHSSHHASRAPSPPHEEHPPPASTHEDKHEHGDH